MVGRLTPVSATMSSIRVPLVYSSTTLSRVFSSILMGFLSLVVRR